MIVLVISKLFTLLHPVSSADVNGETVCAAVVDRSMAPREVGIHTRLRDCFM